MARSESQYQCIVVVAGCAAAIRLAQKGIRTLLVERADEGGAKNLSGGILWGNDLAQVLPDWKATMPVERPVSNKKVCSLSENGPAHGAEVGEPEREIGAPGTRARGRLERRDRAACIERGEPEDRVRGPLPVGRAHGPDRK